MDDLESIEEAESAQIYGESPAAMLRPMPSAISGMNAAPEEKPWYTNPQVLIIAGLAAALIYYTCRKANGARQESDDDEFGETDDLGTQDVDDLEFQGGDDL
jgi:hypothetical protein